MPVTAEALDAEQAGLWSLFRVGSQAEPAIKGREKRERAWQFALVPHGEATRRGDKRGWTHEGDVRSGRVLVDLAALLGSYFEQDDGHNDSVHIAVQMEVLRVM